VSGERPTHRCYPAAGIFAGAIAWFVNTAGNYALAGILCGWGLPPVLFVSAVTLGITVWGGTLSWQALLRSGPVPAGHGGAPRRMLAALGVMSAALFAAIILIQGAAGLVFDGCER
jgi:hypothetical protein